MRREGPISVERKETGLEGDFRRHRKGDQFSPEYLKLNPKAVVPTLIHDGKVIRESTVVNEYLDEVFPSPALKPDDPMGRAQMRLWTKMVDEGLHLSCAAVTFSLFIRHKLLKMSASELDCFLESTPDPAFRERKRHWVKEGIEAPDVKAAIKFHDKVLADMEATLTQSRWLAGDQYTLADVSLTPYVNRLEMLGLSGMWSNRPRVSDWFDRIRARANFKSAVLDWIPEELVSSMKANGSTQWPFVSKVLWTA